MIVSGEQWRDLVIYTHVSILPCASLVAQLVKDPPAMWETWVRFLSLEDPLEKGKATNSSILAWEFHGLYSPWIAKSGTWLSDFHILPWTIWTHVNPCPIQATRQHWVEWKALFLNEKRAHHGKHNLISSNLLVSKLISMELLLCTWYCVKFFTWIVSFDT